MTQQRWIILIGSVVALAIFFFIYNFSTGNQKEQISELTVKVRRGAFPITVMATGELQAKKSVKIRGPQGMRTAGIYETTISNLVPEGTVVKAGDFVAALDRTELADKMKTAQTEIEKIQSQMDQAQIDTAIEMRQLRDELVNLAFSKKEKLLRLEQSKYEPKSVIQEAEIDLERTDRDIRQLERKYELKEKQSVARIQEISTLLRQQQQQFNNLMELGNEFTVMAPESGMVIYARSWNGKKEPGSRLSAWDPIVAELPDLTDMISRTYVNEVDISKVKEGQPVTVEVDAFPDNKYTGQVLSVANIGEQLRGYDAKVFEVTVQVNEVDSILRPAMTTSNEIVTETFEDVLSVPLEALQVDSLSFVYVLDNGSIYKREVMPGLSNDREVIIELGLAENEEVYLTEPDNAEELDWQYLDPAAKESILEQQRLALEARKQRDKERQDAARKLERPANNNSGDGGSIIIF